jgi:hypothetical protein
MPYEVMILATQKISREIRRYKNCDSQATSDDDRQSLAQNGTLSSTLQPSNAPNRQGSAAGYRQ